MNIEAEVINLNLPLAFSTKDALTDAIEDIFSGIFLQKENLKLGMLKRKLCLFYNLKRDILCLTKVFLFPQQRV
jgi:hypothetical protein